MVVALPCSFMSPLNVMNQDFKLFFSKKYFRNTIRMSKGLDPDLASRL